MTATENKLTREWRSIRSMPEHSTPFDETARGAVEKIDYLILEYLASHPDFKYLRRGNRHPAILATVGPIANWLVGRMGGRASYLEALLDAAEEWFPPGGDRRKFGVFYNSFQLYAHVRWDDPEYAAITARFLAWSRKMFDIFGPRRTTAVEEFRDAQQRTYLEDFNYIIDMCSRRLTFAVHAPFNPDSQFDDEDAGDEDESPFVLIRHRVMEALLTRYIECIYWPQQADLFSGWGNCPEDLWRTYFNNVLVPKLVLDMGIVRDVLCLAGKLPKNVGPKFPGKSLCQRLSRMEMPEPS